jgi:hypothetical protein
VLVRAAGTDVALRPAKVSIKRCNRTMKELASSLAQLFAIIFLTITLAVSITALSLWADSGAQPAQAVSMRAGVP